MARQGVFPTSPDSLGLAVRFTEHNLHIFFDSITVLLLVLFQGVTWMACFYRLVLALLDQKRIDIITDGNDHERHMFRGIVWIAIGIKLGFVESIVAFATAEYGLALTRRILLLLARACLIIGVVKG